MRDGGTGRSTDLTGAVRALTTFCTGLAALVALCLQSPTTFGALRLISVCHAAALAPMTTLARCAGAPGRRRQRDGTEIRIRLGARDRVCGVHRRDAGQRAGGECLRPRLAYTVTDEILVHVGQRPV